MIGNKHDWLIIPREIFQSLYFDWVIEQCRQFCPECVDDVFSFSSILVKCNDKGIDGQHGKEERKGKQKGCQVKAYSPHQRKCLDQTSYMYEQQFIY